MALTWITVLLVCQLAGEALVLATGIPIPGPVVGMVILFAGLAIKGRVPDGLQQTAGRLLEHLSLLFVPAGVGVTVHVSLLTADGWPIGAALVGSTVVTIAVTGMVMQALARKGDRG